MINAKISVNTAIELILSTDFTQRKKQYDANELNNTVEL